MREVQMAYRCKVPQVYSILAQIPPEDQPKDKAAFWFKLAEELSRLMEYSSQAVEPEIVLSEFRKAGSQYIWEFWANDLSLPLSNAHNWHGQNVSRWLYAGAIVLQKGEVSTHH